MPRPHPLFDRPDPGGSREAAKIVLVGQAPSRQGAATGRAALGGRVGAKIMGLLGCDLRTYVRTFRRLNLIPDYPGPAEGGNGDAFPQSVALAWFARLHPNLRDRKVVALGAKVGGILAGGALWGWCQPKVVVRIAPYRRATDLTVPYHLFVLPHPSGLNHWWNDEGNARMASEALRAFTGLDSHAQ